MNSTNVAIFLACENCFQVTVPPTTQIDFTSTTTQYSTDKALYRCYKCKLFEINSLLQVPTLVNKLKVCTLKETYTANFQFYIIHGISQTVYKISSILIYGFALNILYPF